MRVEANRLRKELKREIREGAPGGRSFAPLSMISRRYRPDRKPLARLAIPVRYWVENDGGYRIKVGYSRATVRDSHGRAFSYRQVSASWARLALLHQEGRDIPLSNLARVGLARLGGRLKKQGRDDMAKYFFLRKSTRRARIPARPIIEPFWSAHREEARRNIVMNFHRKLRGERI